MCQAQPALLAWVRSAAIAAVLWLAFPAAAQEDAGVTVTVETRTERPPQGSLRRGYFAARPWFVYGVGAVSALAAAGFLVWRATKKR